MKNIKLIVCFLLVSAFAKAQQLQSYIQEAEQNNPKIQAFELRYRVSKERISEVNSLPNTQVSLGYFVSEPETRTGAQRAKFSVKQMLPWFGTIKAKENYSKEVAETEYLDFIITKRKLALSVSQTYYNLYEIYTKQRVLEDNIKLLKTYEQLALTSVQIGKASAVDVLRLQIRQNELQQQKEVLQQAFAVEQVRLNSFLNRAGTSVPIGLIEMIIPEKDPVLENEGILLNPELLKYDKRYQSIALLEVLNQKESAPQIGFGLDYVPVSERTDVVINDNGKDIIMPMVSLSIPVFNKKHSSKTRQYKLQQEEVKAQKEEQLNHLQVLLEEAISKRTTARIKNNTQKKNLIQAKNAEQILIKSYETGTIDFKDVLDIQELQLKFEMNHIESVKQYYIQTAIIHYLTN